MPLASHALRALSAQNTARSLSTCGPIPSASGLTFAHVQSKKFCTTRLSSRSLTTRTSFGATEKIRAATAASRTSLFRKLMSTEATVNASESAKGSRSKSSFPDVSSKAVAYWLLGSAASVFGIVVFGGLTRLTESGLSITEWRPVTGSIPPMNQDDWEVEFNKYKNSPEYALLNPNMDLGEFKSIYYMEWIHRIWGRVLGISFAVPAAYFIAKRRVSKPMAWTVTGIGGLIGFQGFIGWWMVASGLKTDLFAPGSHPRVSQYRLATHLSAAFICYVAMLSAGLSILRAHKLLKTPDASIKLLKTLRDPRLKTFKRSVAALAALVFLTSMTGALVAGLDAGLIYNEFPRMGNGFAPPTSELFDDHYARKDDKSDLWWRNCFENPSLVQLNHRILATTTFTAACALAIYAKKKPSVRSLLPRSALRGAHGVLGFAVMQASLGISTLIYLVPVPLASMHQAGSLLLLTWVFVLGGRVWHPSHAARLLQMIKKGKPVHVSGMKNPIQQRISSSTSNAAKP